MCGIEFCGVAVEGVTQGKISCDQVSEKWLPYLLIPYLGYLKLICSVRPSSKDHYFFTLCVIYRHSGFFNEIRRFRMILNVTA